MVLCLADALVLTMVSSTLLCQNHVKKLSYRKQDALTLWHEPIVWRKVGMVDYVRHLIPHAKSGGNWKRGTARGYG